MASACRSRPSARLPRAVIATATLVLLSTLPGCSSPGSYFDRGPDLETLRQAVIGLPRDRLLACAGRPDTTRLYETGEQMTWYRGHEKSTRYGADDPTLDRTRRAAPVTSADRYCRVDVALVNGVARNVRFLGRTGALIGRGRECVPVLERCAAMRAFEPEPAPTAPAGTGTAL